MAVAQVNQAFLSELVEEMGIPLARATRALHFSGNSSIDAAVNWLFDHETDPDIDQLPLVPVDIAIEESAPFQVSEEVKLKSEELRNRARRKKEEEETKRESNREKERRRAGKELIEARRIQEENERIRLRALQRAEKEQEKRDRDRIRQKLQQDKAERRQRLGMPLEDPPSTRTIPPQIQENKVSLPVKFSAIHAPVAKEEVLRDCLKHLKRMHMDDDRKVRRAFQTLLIYIRNIANHPDEEKFRKIRLSNPAFQERVGNMSGGIKFLENCGFERVEGGKFLFLPREKVDMGLLKSAATLLNSALTNPFFGLLSKFGEEEELAPQ